MDLKKDNLSILFEKQVGESKNRRIHKELNALLDKKHWTGAMFYSCTGLSESVYKKIRNLTVKPSKESIVAICVGAHCSYEESVQLLSLAGFVLGDSKEDIAYRLILQYIDAVNPEDPLRSANDLLQKWKLATIPPRCKE